jgi:hypothetical protein
MYHYSIRKLPVFEAVGFTLTKAFMNLRFIVGTSVIPLLLVMMVVWLFPTTSGKFYLAAFGGDVSPGAMIVIGLAWFAAYVVSMAAFAVNWHRHVLLGEQFKPFMMIWSEGPVWRYVGMILLLSLVAVGFGLVFGVIGFLAKLNVAFAILGLVLLLTGMFFFTVLFTRMSLCLVSVAIEEGREGPFSILSYATDNFWRILFMLFLVGIVFSIPEYVFSNMAVRGAPRAYAVSLFFQMWVSPVMTLGIITTLYGFFVQGREFRRGELVKIERKTNSESSNWWLDKPSPTVSKPVEQPEAKEPEKKVLKKAKPKARKMPVAVKAKLSVKSKKPAQKKKP